MPLLNYTTTVPVHRTTAEIAKALVKAGARGIAQEYNPQGHMVGMSFAIDIPGDDTYHYTLPVRVGAVRDVLVRQKVERKYQTFEHAERVAWRIVRDWVQAQMAIIETEMVSLRQVMLPYMRTDNGLTVFDRYEMTRALPQGTPALHPGEDT
jgi:hypothetical protein